ncbi:MAG: GNAT family N-acetyltransferase [Caulobacterales bacterium]
MNARVQIIEPISPILVPQVRVDVARTLDDLVQVAAIRAVVYMGEQVCPFAEEFDGNDFSGATHLIARSAGEPVGVMRLRWFAEFVKIERFAVLKEHRGGEVARALFTAGYDLAARKGYRRVLGYVQVRLWPFMQRVGGLTRRPGRARFVVSDHEYMEVERALTPPADAVSIDADPLVVLRPEGAWRHPGVLDRSAGRPATNPH